VVQKLEELLGASQRASQRPTTADAGVPNRTPPPPVVTSPTKPATETQRQPPPEMSSAPTPGPARRTQQPDPPPVANAEILNDARPPTIQPTTWEEIRAGLLNLVSDDDTISVDIADPKFIAMTIKEHGGERSQTVMLTVVEGLHGPSWLRVESGFAALSPEAAVAAVNFVAEEENSGVGVTRLFADFLALRWTAAIGTVPLSDVFVMIDGVAAMADRLESELSGQDQF